MGVTRNSLQLTVHALLVREHVSVFDTGAWFSHHIGHGIAPLLIMRRLFVLGGIIGSAIDFDQYKTCGIILLLDDIKSGNTWFVNAVTSIFNGGCPKSFNPVGLNTDKNMDYKHHILLR